MRGSKIKKRGDSYSFRYDLPPGPDGTRQQKTETVRGSLKDAQRRQREILSQIDQGNLSWKPVRKALGEYLNEFLKNYSNPNTRRTFENGFKAFRSRLGDNTIISDLTTEMLQQVVYDLSDEHYTLRSINTYFGTIKRALKHAQQPGLRYLLHDPCKDVIVERPKKLRVSNKVWDDDQVGAFLGNCGTFKGTKSRYITLFLLLIKTGLRDGEAMALPWPLFDPDAEVLQVTRTIRCDSSFGPPKSENSYRTVELDEETVELLKKHRLWQIREKLRRGEGYNPDNLVFTTRTGSHMWPSNIDRAFEDLCKLWGLPYITVHGLRHTHATMLLKSGRTISEVAERLGDTEETVSSYYSHVTRSMKREMVRTVSQVFKLGNMESKEKLKSVIKT